MGTPGDSEDVMPTAFVLVMSHSDLKLLRQTWGPTRLINLLHGFKDDYYYNFIVSVIITIRQAKIAFHDCNRCPSPSPSIPPAPQVRRSHVCCTTRERPDTADRYRLACSDSAAKTAVKQACGQPVLNIWWLCRTTTTRVHCTSIKSMLLVICNTNDKSLRDFLLKEAVERASFKSLDTGDSKHVMRLQRTTCVNLATAGRSQKLPTSTSSTDDQDSVNDT